MNPAASRQKHTDTRISCYKKEDIADDQRGKNPEISTKGKRTCVNMCECEIFQSHAGKQFHITTVGDAYDLILADNLLDNV